MILQSDISGFVSLIKTLKKQNSSPRLNQYKCFNNEFHKSSTIRLSKHRKKLLNFDKKQNCLKKESYPNELHFTQIKMQLETQQQKKRNYLKNYCSYIQKRRQLKYHNFSFRKVPQFFCDGASSIKYIRVPHKGSNTSHIFNNRSSETNIQNKKQNQKFVKLNIFRNTIRQNTLRSVVQQKQFNLRNMHINSRNKRDSFANKQNNLSPIIPRNASFIRNNKQRNSIKLQNMTKDVWEIDPWQQNIDSKDKEFFHQKQY